MIKTSTAIALVLAFVGGSAALAADLPHKAPVAVPYVSQAYDWSGFYVGANVGGGWGSSENTLTTFDSNNVNLSLGSQNLHGFVGGGYAGYNAALPGTPLLFGIEGDFEALGLQGSGPCLTLLTCTDKSTWEADIAGRVGFAYDRALLFVKSGLAWAHFDHSVSGFGGDQSFTVSGSETPMGILFGAGVEFGITKNWIARLEYDFIDFQDKTIDLHDPGIGNGGLTSVDYRKSMNMVKAGVSYKF